MNKFQTIGRLTAKPETKTAGSTTVTKFTVVSSEKWKDAQGNLKEESQFHNCESWGKQGEIIEKYFDKGDGIYVEGKLVYDKYENKDGVKMTAAKIKVFTFEFLPSKAAQQQTQNDGATSDALPF